VSNSRALARASLRLGGNPIVAALLLTLTVGMTRHWLSAALVLCGCAAVFVFLDTETSDPFAVAARAQAKAQQTSSASQLVNTAPAQQTNAVTAGVWPLMENYFEAVAKKQTNATSLGQEVLTIGTNDWNALTFFSWRIFHDRGIKQRDRVLALVAAERAFRLTEGTDPTVLDTYARALWENDRRSEAITHQRKAVELCKEEAKRIDMEANLNRYVRLSREAQR
jgi:hypothetical protein